MKGLVIFFLVIFILGDRLYAQDANSETDEQYAESGVTDPADISAKIGYTDEPIHVKRFDNKKWEEVVDGRDYLEDAREPGKKKKLSGGDTTFSQSPRDGKRFQRSQDGSDNSEEFTSSGGAITSPILTFVFYVVAIGIIAYILFLILKNVSFKSGPKVQKTAAEHQATTVEDIQELEIDRLLRQAMASGNYRLVVRLYFLELLQKLDQDGIITWKKDKTNRDYLSELFSKASYYDEIRRLTLAYEQVWYGDHQLPMQAYHQVIASFKALNERLKTSKPQ